MDAADPPGREPADPGDSRHRERSTDRRRADRTLRNAHREIARPDLARIDREARKLRVVESDNDLAVEHADRGGHRTCSAHLTLRLASHLDSLARWKAVRDERRLERDHGARLAYFVGDPDHARSLRALIELTLHSHALPKDRSESLDKRTKGGDRVTIEQTRNVTIVAAGL